ncbi:MAG: putative O-methyltransferase [Candidatus Accumulibacter adjunctus]|uniref:O-methyltransferase n=1 Tax=Candidatus Accumulibacter adjunctus TaxID=1454001 RepID=A0A011NRU0_9PROT|nr:MAG: putative O-methyltransferase [Candidatus Accumulibacter adjunctus]
MRIITGQPHRERILKSFFPNCRILEWGSGGSTLWFADRLPAGATLTSIDHDPVWHERVQARLGARGNVRLMVCPPSASMGQNATVEEEDPGPVQGYIHAMDAETFDVILVDGVARNACMAAARRLLRPGGAIFLHDAHRPWYDEGKSLYFAYGTVGSCPEYPGPLLWWGGLAQEEPRYSVGALPVVVSFFTQNTPYEVEAARLRESVARLGMEAEIVGVPSQGTWERNCAYKARFIRDVYFRLDQPVLWLDADAVVHKHPLMVAGAEPDFAIHRCDGWQFNSATVYFNRTALGQLLLENWVRYCETQPDIWDQIHLDRAWEEVTARHPLHTMWLPQDYAKIFDQAWEEVAVTLPDHDDQAVIEQFQASRRLKEEISDRPPRKMRNPSSELVAARRAGRPRSSFYDSRFVLLPEPSAPDDWAVTPGNSDEDSLRRRLGSLWTKLARKFRA